MNLLLVLFFASIAAGLAVTPLVRYAAVAFGVIDKPSERKVHLTPTPRMGGLAIALCFYAALFVAWKAGIFHYTEKFRGILYGSIIILITGIIDDVTGIRPKYKLLIQCLSAFVFLYYGSKITVFIKNDIVNNIVTFAWVVLITNSFNLLDNMDGLSGGVAMICSLIFFYVAFKQHQPALMVVSLLLAGSILGFMRYNYSPASIFMGDTGSLFIGFLLAAISTECTYLVESRLTRLPIVTPLMVLSVPIFDTLSVIIIRLKEKRHIFQADKRHFSHRLADMGMSKRTAVLVVWLVTVTTGINATLLTSVNIYEAFTLFLHTMAIYAIIIMLMSANGLKNKEGAN